MSWERRINKMEAELNRQADRGWALVRSGPWRWGFAPCEPGEFRYRIIVLDWPNTDNRPYLELLAETGAQIIQVYSGGTLAIVRRPTALGPFEITGSTSARLVPERARANLAYGMTQAGYWLLAVAAVLLILFIPGARITTWQLALATLGGGLLGLGGMFIIMGNLNWRRSNRQLTTLINEAFLQQ